MAKEVKATVSFLVNDEFAKPLQDMLANSYCWINESWFELFPETWKNVYNFEINDIKVENI